MYPCVARAPCTEQLAYSRTYMRRGLCKNLTQLLELEFVQSCNTCTHAKLRDICAIRIVVGRCFLARTLRDKLPAGGTQGLHARAVSCFCIRLFEVVLGVQFDVFI
jgi:hypothetical protein